MTWNACKLILVGMASSFRDFAYISITFSFGNSLLLFYWSGQGITPIQKLVTILLILRNYMASCVACVEQAAAYLYTVMSRTTCGLLPVATTCSNLDRMGGMNNVTHLQPTRVTLQLVAYNDTIWLMSLCIYLVTYFFL